MLMKSCDATGIAFAVASKVVFAAQRDSAGNLDGRLDDTVTRRAIGVSSKKATSASRCDASDRSVQDVHSRVTSERSLN